MKYIPSVAFSLCDHREDADFEPLRPFIRTITAQVLREGLPRGVCLNVNSPLHLCSRGLGCVAWLLVLGSTRCQSAITHVDTIIGGWWAITAMTSLRLRIPTAGLSITAMLPSPPPRSILRPMKLSTNLRPGHYNYSLFTVHYSLYEVLSDCW